jgi:hypothetical protein
MSSVCLPPTPPVAYPVLVRCSRVDTQITLGSSRAENRRARFGPLPAILWALLVGALTFLADVGGGWYYAPWVPIRSFSHALLHAAVVSVIAFIIVYVAQLLFSGWWVRPDHQARFCPRCRTVQPKTSGTQCACGEPLELLRNWKWIPDDANAS